MKTNEIAGMGNHNTAEFWEYDTRLGRRWNLDPKPTVGLSYYSVLANNPIVYADLNGDTTNYYSNNDGKYLGTVNGGNSLGDRFINDGDFEKAKWRGTADDGNTLKEQSNNPHVMTMKLKSQQKKENSAQDYENSLENYLNNEHNVHTTVLDLNSDVGVLARIGYAEFRNGNGKEIEAGQDATRNRSLQHYRGANSYLDAYSSPSQYSSYSDRNRAVFDNPYNYANANIFDAKSWRNAVTGAFKVHNNLSNITGGAIFFFSPNSMKPPGSHPSWYNAKKVVNVPGTRPGIITLQKQ
ncbi:hypothetical protein ACTHGU_03620 [Chitinophagaceae bacterium MMS25-I14]